MADKFDLSSISDGEASGHPNGEAGNASMPEPDNSNSVRARTKTVMLGGSFAQQIREKLGFDREEDSEDGFVQVRTVNNGSARPVHQSYPQSNQLPRNVDVALESRLTAKQSPSYNSAARAVREEMPPIVGFIVSYDRHASGEVYELRLGRWIVSSSATMSDNFLVIDDESISQNHATLRIKSGTDIQLIDQFSEHGTGVIHSGGTEEESLIVGAIGHADIIRFGHRSFHVSIVNKA